MPRIEIVTQIAASPEVVFDRSRDLDLHADSMAHTGEQAIAGRTSGLIELGEEVTWRARHFGLMHEHTSRITAYDRPRHFCDEMVRGRFQHFRHDHYFESVPAGTKMTDVIDFASPGGPLGSLVDWLFLASYLENLIRLRNQTIKDAAEVAA